MTDSKTVELPEIGKILFERSYKAKYINISVKPFKGVRVAVPVWATFEKATCVALEKAEWIKTRQEEARRVERQQQESSFFPSYISKAYTKGIIIGRLEELANKYNISYNKVFIRNQKTRWGSCSAKRNINLNYKIALLPAELMDYIILHELVHIKHLNHGRHFWDELDKLVGNAKSLDRQLNGYNGLLFQ